MPPNNVSTVPVKSLIQGSTAQFCATPNDMPLNVRSGKFLTRLYISRYNARTLIYEERMQSLKEQVCDMKKDVTGISEMRVTGEGVSRKSNGNIS